MSSGNMEIEAMYSLKVDNLAYDVDVPDLEESFGKFGKIGDIHIPRDPTRGYRSKGYAFVRFQNKRDAEEAIEALDGRRFRSREIRVAYALHGRPRNARERFRHGGRSAYEGGGDDGGGSSRRDDGDRGDRSERGGERGGYGGSRREEGYNGGGGGGGGSRGGYGGGGGGGDAGRDYDGGREYGGSNPSYGDRPKRSGGGGGGGRDYQSRSRSRSPPRRERRASPTYRSNGGGRDRS